MAYEKQNFKNGEILTAARLNAMDDGIKRAVDGVDNLMPIYEDLVVTSTRNLFDYNSVRKGSWANSGSGQIENYPDDNKFVENYGRTERCAIIGGEVYSISADQYPVKDVNIVICYYDSNDTFISSITVTGFKTAQTVVAPTAACSWIISFSVYSYIPETLMINLGEAHPYMPFGEEEIMYTLPNLKVSPEQLTDAEIVMSDNIFDKTTVVVQSWAHISNGNIENYPDNSNISNYMRSDYIPVSGNTKYTVSNLLVSRSGVYAVFYDSNKRYISTTPIATLLIGEYLTFTTPANANYVIIDFANKSASVEKLMINEGDEPLPYEPYGMKGYRLNRLIVAGAEDSVTNILVLPKQYSLVVGDTFELFYKGIINAVNPDMFDVVVSCSVGNAYSKRFIWTPESKDVGTKTLSIELYDYNRKLVGSGSVNLVVSAKKTHGESDGKINILCIGDSLTENGVWPAEFRRRLVATDGTPVGDGMSNIEFIGTRVSGAVRYEGYGGWKFDSYNTEKIASNAKVITCSGHDKVSADQHSVYKDANGRQWKLETIEADTIKILDVTGGSTFPATGTLTWVSGGVNHSNIVYTASTNGVGNPFWNATTQTVDFANYASNLGVSSIDFVYVLLGWNDSGTDDATYKQQVKTFIDNVHASFPYCQIVIIGLQIPARDGLGNNYGASGTLSRYYDSMQHVFRLDTIYAEISNTYSYVDAINLSGQFDTENNSITATRPVNIRNENTEVYQSNGVHPATTGSKQIADAAYRDFVSRL